MVIYVYAGGGSTEFGGLTIFLERNFPSHKFIRKTPVRQKPGPRPGCAPRFHVFGQSGNSLAEQIKYFLSQSDPKENCEAILILDDLDCHDLSERTDMFRRTLAQFGTFADKKHLIGFAKPEIEAWLVADWEGISTHYKDWCNYKDKIRIKLAQAYQESTEGGDIAEPENFSRYDDRKDACHEKLSEVIRQVFLEEAGIHYSKATHSSEFLRNARAERIAHKCPVFRDLYSQLRRL